MKTAPLIAAALLLVAVVAPAQDAPKGFVGKKAPAFSFTTLEGTKLSNAKLKGKVVLLDFWATWCGNCLKASPTMQKLSDTYGTKGLVVVAVNAKETKARPAASQAYKKTHGTTYPMVSNGDAAHALYKAPGLPIIVVIDRQGVVKAIFNDFVTETTPAQLEAAVKAAL